MRRLAAFVACTCISAEVLAAPCPDGDRAFVRLTVEVQPPDKFIADALERHLRGELGARDIDVCPSDGKGAPIARIHLRVVREGASVRAIIQVRDQVTDKLVERTIDLTSAPADTRPLLVATATDELLRASWTELAMADAPAPAMPPPPAVTQAVKASLAPKTTTHDAPLRIGLGGAFLVQTRRTAIGVESFLGYDFARPWSAELRLAAMRGLSREGPDGEAHIDDVVLSPSVVRALGPLTIGAGFAFRLASLRSDANAFGRAERALDATFGPRVEARAQLAFGAFGLYASASGEWALRPVRALDRGVTVTAIEGPSIGLAIGVFLRP